MGEDTQAWPPTDTNGKPIDPGIYVHLRNVNHPPHYNAGKIEVIEFVEDQRLNFSRGNVIKYVARAGKKNSATELQDLKKAAWYLAREIELLEAARDIREPKRPNDMNPRT